MEDAPVCLTCDQSSHRLILRFLSVHYFLEMLEYFFLDAKKPMFIFVLHCFMQIYISLSTNRTHHGTLFEGTNYNCIQCRKHALNINPHKSIEYIQNVIYLYKMEHI